MSIPVIIPACNEAPRIGRTLEALHRQVLGVTPYVVVNGSTDRTADLATSTGATVLESEHGKMRAIQAGLQHLGRSALEPLLLLDADTRPFTNRWSACFKDALVAQPYDRPKILWAPVAFKDDINPVIGSGMTLYTAAVSWTDRNDSDPRTIRGCNMGLHILSEEVLEAIQELDNYWPREDVALYDTVIERGGTSNVLFSSDAWANTSGHRYRLLPMLRKQLRDRRHPNRLADEEYDTRTPNGARPYNSAHTRHPNKNPDVHLNPKQ